MTPISSFRISTEDLAGLPNVYPSTSAHSDCRLTLDVATQHNKMCTGGRTLQRHEQTADLKTLSEGNVISKDYTHKPEREIKEQL